jgi:hypothetical protein
MTRTYSNRFSLSVAPPTVPPWVPAPGTIANVNLNSISDVEPCPARTCVYSGQIGVFGMFGYSGGAVLNSHGTWGALGMWGGGHDAYYGNEVYLFSFDDRRWRRMKEPGLYGRDDDDLIDDWGQYADGEPAAPHTVQGFFGLPPELGGGPEGSFVQVSMAAMGLGAVSRRGSYIFDLATKKWSKYPTTLSPFDITYLPAVLDPVHGKFYAAFGPQANWGDKIQILDCATRTWSAETVPGGFGVFSVLAAPLGYCPTLDCLVFLRVLDPRDAVHSGFTGVEVWTVPCANLTEGWTKRATNVSTGFALNWVPSVSWSPLLGKFGVYSGMGQNWVWYLEPPATMDGTWHWSQEHFSGEAPTMWLSSASHGTSPYNRFNWVDKLKCWSWYTLSAGPVQLWRPAGT